MRRFSTTRLVRDLQNALERIDVALMCQMNGDMPKALAEYRRGVVRFEAAYRRAVATLTGAGEAAIVADIGRAFADYWRQTQIFLARRNARGDRLWQAYVSTLQPAGQVLQRRCDDLLPPDISLSMPAMVAAPVERISPWANPTS